MGWSCNFEDYAHESEKKSQRKMQKCFYDESGVGGITFACFNNLERRQPLVDSSSDNFSTASGMCHGENKDF
jgi:hypothetical protein